VGVLHFGSNSASNSLHIALSQHLLRFLLLHTRCDIRILHVQICLKFVKSAFKNIKPFQILQNAPSFQEGACVVQRLDPLTKGLYGPARGEDFSPQPSPLLIYVHSHLPQSTLCFVSALKTRSRYLSQCVRSTLASLRCVKLCISQRLGGCC